MKTKAFNIKPKSNPLSSENHPDWEHDEDETMYTTCCTAQCEDDSDICSHCGEHAELIRSSDIDWSV